MKFLKWVLAGLVLGIVVTLVFGQELDSQGLALRRVCQSGRDIPGVVKYEVQLSVEPDGEAVRVGGEAIIFLPGKELLVLGRNAQDGFLKVWTRSVERKNETYISEYVGWVLASAVELPEWVKFEDLPIVGESFEVLNTSWLRVYPSEDEPVATSNFGSQLRVTVGTRLFARQIFAMSPDEAWVQVRYSDQLVWLYVGGAFSRSEMQPVPLSQVCLDSDLVVGDQIVGQVDADQLVYEIGPNLVFDLHTGQFGTLQEPEETE